MAIHPELIAGRVHVVFQGEGPPMGKQLILRFGNGYGVSVIQSSISYGQEEGLYELAVARFIGEGDDWLIDCNTPITDDVIGWLDEHGVIDIAQQVHDLPPHMRSLP